jgi:hypothetical protein
MHRRAFFQSGIGVAAAGALWSTPGEAAPATAGAKASAAPSPLSAGTAGDHRRRLENVRICQQGIRTCLRKHLVTSYLPGQCCYNLGEYPCVKPWDPDDWDERELDKLRDQGIQLIQVHEEWNDSQRLYGGHKLAPVNPAGFRRFVDMVHRRGMKLIVYVSSGFFQRTDPDFRPEWARAQDLIEIYFDYARCSPASPGWRAYLLPRLVRILDEYGVDGFYNDLGYIPLGGNRQPPTQDEVLAFQEDAEHDGAVGDLLAMIYAEVNRRGGIVKVHASATSRPMTDLKIYDYLWVGEGARSGDRVREAVKDHPPYVVPCVDMSRAKIDNEDELYLHAIPYLQFPLLLAGRPFTGQRAAIPGIKYPPEDRCFWTRHCRAIWRHYQAHPEGPHSFGWWDSVPGRPEARPTHARWLALYRPMVEEGTWAWLELGENSLLAQPLPKEVVASAMANRELYLVLANYGRTAAEVQTTDRYVPADDPAGKPSRRTSVPPRSLRILKRAAKAEELGVRR